MNLERAYPWWFAACASAGAIIGKLTGQGAIQGLVTGLLVAAAPLVLLVLGIAVQSAWRPILPPYRCGKCTHRQYRVAPAAPGDADAPGAPVGFSCPECGRIYQASGASFDELAADGRVIPYMRHSPWGRWKKA